MAVPTLGAGVRKRGLLSLGVHWVGCGTRILKLLREDRYGISVSFSAMTE
jgi:hypothetical protein